MSCIAAIVQNGRIHMAAESITTHGSDRVVPIRATKLFRHRSGFMIGFVGRTLAGQLFRAHFEPPARRAREDDLAYLERAFMPAMVKCIESNGPKNADIGYEFLLGFNGTLYLGFSDGTVGPVPGKQAAIGSGGQVAMGALMMAPRGMSIRSRLHRSVEIATELVQSTHPPVVHLSGTGAAKVEIEKPAVKAREGADQKPARRPAEDNVTELPRRKHDAA